MQPGCVMEKRVFVSGIAGFVGSHVALALQERGDIVWGCDNFNDYYDPALKRQRQRFLEAVGIEVRELDICDTVGLEEQVRSYGATHFLHLAAQAGVRYSLSNPQAYIHSNVRGFTSVLETVRKIPGMKLVYASSSSVYGKNTKVPFAETDRTDHQASLYGVTKRANELMAQTYHDLYGMDAWGLRFFTVYGPWGRPDMAYYGFTKAMLAGETIRVFNGGDMSRDFTYIDDIVNGTLAAIDGCHGCELFNLGNHRPEPLMKMIEILEKLLGLQARKEFVGMQSGDVQATYACLKKSNGILGYEPQVSLEEGLRRFVDWYRHSVVDQNPLPVIHVVD